jgi:RNA-directed DNA polymerase
MSDKTHVHGDGESHSNIVPAKQPNKSGKPLAEAVEGRTLTKENMDQPNQCRTQKRESWQSRLAHVREAAKKDKKSKFTALLHHVTVDLLRDSYYALKRGAAPGVEWRHVARIWKGLGGAIEKPSWSYPSRSLSSVTVTKNLDTQS